MFTFYLCRFSHAFCLCCNMSAELTASNYLRLSTVYNNFIAMILSLLVDYFLPQNFYAFPHMMPFLFSSSTYDNISLFSR